MRGADGLNVPQGLTVNDNAISRSQQYPVLSMASRTMRLKLSGKLTREISERRQVGDAETMVNEGAWWRDFGMEEGL